jgi:tRNA (mo5U34)-methyltransferase
MPTLAERVEAIQWYHTLELAPGVVTPGHFDTRGAVDKVPLPARLDGLRCLDVGTWDGFWAFEMERRGAASVTAIDVADPERWDWPAQMRLGENAGLAYLSAFKAAGAGFRLAHEALGSRVEWRDRSVYELDPEIDGRFDVVLLGSLLLHLRDPVGALERIRSVCARDLVLTDTVELISSIVRPRTPTARLEGVDRPWWWQPNVAALRRMVHSAGFEIVERRGLHFVALGASHPRPPWRGLLRSLATPATREGIVNRVLGVPHSALRARPLPVEPAA